jgi:hypothetical protein
VPIGILNSNLNNFYTVILIIGFRNAPVPLIDLPDLQLQNHLWETYINATISFWIDPDASDEWLAKLSETKLDEVIICFQLFN